jgi:hypothetical protein
MSRVEDLWVDVLLPVVLAAAAFALGLAWRGRDLPPAPPLAIDACVL